MIHTSKKKYLLLFSFIGLALIFSNGVASAAKWPENGWGADGYNVNASIDLFRNDNHNKNKSGVLGINFRAYTAGNTASSPLTVNIVKDSNGANTGCDLKGNTQLWVYSYLADTDNTADWSSIQVFERCDINPNKPNVPYFGNSRAITISSGEYNSELNKTVYKVGVALINPEIGARFRFDAQADNVEFGFGERGQLYFSIDGSGGDTYKDLAINVCVSNAGIKTFRSYDPDNVVGSSVQPTKYFDFALKSKSVRKKAYSTSASGAGSWIYNQPEKYRYIPAFSSGSTVDINYDMQKDKKYVFKMNNLGVNNYVSLQMPGREVCDPTKVDPDWDIDSDSVAEPNVIYKGESTTFKHKIWNKGPLATDESVDGDIVRQWNSTGEWHQFDLTSGYSVETKDTATKTYNDPQSFSDVGQYTEYVRVDPENDDDEDTSFTTTSTSTAWVVQPTATTTVPNGYEKGSGGTVTIEHKIAISPCPTTGYTKTVKWTISGIEGNGTAYNEPKDSVLGNGTCEEVIKKTVNGAWLDNKQVGVVATFKSIAPAPFGESEGILTVFEVPFAKFYGNDIYAFKNGDGEIRFNDATKDTDTPPYDRRGSVTEYAALAFGDVKIDTSAFRTFEWTKPPNDTDAPGSALSALYPAGKNRIFDDVKAALPDVCPQMDSGGLNAPQNGCYTIQEGSPTATPTWRRGISVLGWGDTFGAGDTTYNKRVTVYNPSDKMLMIAGNIINGTSFASNPEPEDVGVLLVVSEGPIVIDNNVQRVDAILVSKTGIYTCGFGGFGGFGPDKQVSQATIHKTCRNTLTINGAVAAPIIDFRRAVGSRYLNPVPDTANGYANCNDFAGIKNCNARGNGINDDWTESPLWSGNFPASNPSGGAAEIVNYPAYLYFAKPYLKDKGVSGGEAAAMFVAPPRQ